MVQVKTTLRPECPHCFPDSEFCPTCGEKRFDRRELSLRRFIGNLFEELTDLDARWLKTMYLLTFRPGFLSLEFSRGVRVPYVKPLRLFIVIALVNFLAFGLSTSTDIYSLDTVRFVDRFHFLDAIRHSNLMQAHLNQTMDEHQVSKNIKDVLSVMVYFMIFVMAGIFKLLFRNQHKFYSEHLVFFFHILSAAFLRNFLLLPVLFLSKPLGIFLFMVLQFLYLIVALKRFYSLSTTRAVLTLIPTLMTVAVMMVGVMIFSTIVVLWN